MTIETHADIETLVRNDVFMMDVLRIARELDLPDWWVGAGFLRNRVWDAISENETSIDRDIDLVYFDQSNAEPEADYDIERKLKKIDPLLSWEVCNQARMHVEDAPYTSSEDAIEHWPETATAIAVKLGDDDTLEFLFCYGIDDLAGLVARPTPYFSGDKVARFYERMSQKNWQERWPNLRVEER